MIEPGRDRVRPGRGRGLIAAKRLDAMPRSSSRATARRASRFGFPFDDLLRSHVVGLVSLVVLTLRSHARCAPSSGWRVASVYVGTCGHRPLSQCLRLIVEASRRCARPERGGADRVRAAVPVAESISLVVFRRAWRGGSDEVRIEPCRAEPRGATVVMSGNGQ